MVRGGVACVLLCSSSCSSCSFLFSFFLLACLVTSFSLPPVTPFSLSFSFVLISFIFLFIVFLVPLLLVLLLLDSLHHHHHHLLLLLLLLLRCLLLLPTPLLLINIGCVQ